MPLPHQCLSQQLTLVLTLTAVTTLAVALTPTLTQITSLVKSPDVDHPYTKDADSITAAQNTYMELSGEPPLPLAFPSPRYP